MAVIEGVDHLTGAIVKATDLRAGVAMLIAGLCARGVTQVEEIQYIERGYEDIVGKLRSLGADIRRISIPELLFQKQFELAYKAEEKETFLKRICI